MLFGGFSKYVYYEDITVFKEDGSYTIPDGTVELEAFIVGGGGGGGVPAGVRGSYKAGAKGLGGEVVHQANINFSSAKTFNVTVGAGGIGATKENTPGENGGASSFGDYTAAGGNGGSSSDVTSPTAGTDGVECPIENVEEIAGGSLFGASGADGSASNSTLSGGNTGGGNGANRNSNAENGSFYGAGGGGGEVYKSFLSSTVSNAGNGYVGAVIVRVVVKCLEKDVPLTQKFEVLKDTSLTYWTVPQNVELADIFLVGGGGCGATAVSLRYGGGSPEGGRGGSVFYKEGVNLTPCDTISLKIGTGGKNSPEGSTAESGGNTKFLSYNASGGRGGSETFTGYKPANGKKCPFGSVPGYAEEGDLFGADGGYTYVSNDGYLKTEDGCKTGGGNGGDYGGGYPVATSGSFYGAGGGAAGTESATGIQGNEGKPGYQGIIIIRMYVRKKVLANYTPPA